MSFISSDQIVDSYPPTFKCESDAHKTLPFLYHYVMEKKLPVCLTPAQVESINQIVVIVNPVDLQAESFILPPNFADDIKECKMPWETPSSTELRWIIVPITISGLEEGAHANILIINTIFKEMERFEPYGHNVELYNTESIDFLFEALANDFGYEYIPPLRYCPRGPQIIERPDYDIRALCGEQYGYCSAWVTLYAFMRLLNPDYSRENILIDLLRGGPDRIHIKVRQFVTLMDEIVP